MNDKLKMLIKIVVVLAVIVLVADLIYFIYNKNKNKIFFKSLNSYVLYNGNYYGVGSNNLNNKSKEQATLIKYNSNYREVWSKELNTKYNSAYFNVANDGKYLLAVGSYEKTEDENKDVLRTALFVKYDSDGKVIFKKSYQNLGNSKFVNVLVVDDGYIVVGQSIYPNDVLGNENTGGAIMIKYSKSGKLLWKKNIGGNKSGLFNAVIKSGKYLYVVGKDATRYGIVVKYDLDGNVIKSVSYAKTDTSGFTDVVKVDNYLYVVGSRKNNLDDEYDHDHDALIVKYDLDLNVVKEESYKESKNGIERFNKLIYDGNDLVVVGHTAILDKKNSTEKEYKYYYKGLINKYNLNLKLLNSNVYHNNNDDYFSDVKLINNNYLVSSYYKHFNNIYNTRFLSYSKDLK